MRTALPASPAAIIARDLMAARERIRQGTHTLDLAVEAQMACDIVADALLGLARGGDAETQPGKIVLAALKATR